MELSKKDLLAHITKEAKKINETREYENMFGINCTDAINDGLAAAILSFAGDDENKELETDLFLMREFDIMSHFIDDKDLWSTISGYVENKTREIILQNEKKISKASDPSYSGEPESTIEEI